MSRSVLLVACCSLACCLNLSTAAEPAPDNTPPEGFVALFNGKDLTGWKGLVMNPKKRAELTPEQLAQAQEAADAKAKAHWHIEDGVLHYIAKGPFDNHLCTVKDYGDFELYADWKIDPKGDSGIYLRGSPQVQIWDPTDNPVGSGGLYNNQMHPKDPLAVADKPLGQWNTFYVKMVGDHVTVKLNDVLVVDTVMENYWEREKPLYPTGQIELQTHNTDVWFKNIYLRELPRE